MFVFYRYHYFLQLKQDVIEGRWSCTPQQATELASYCMQAEFGNFDSERHTALYLKEFQLFPKVSFVAASNITCQLYLNKLTDLHRSNDNRIVNRDCQ